MRNRMRQKDIKYKNNFCKMNSNVPSECVLLIPNKILYSVKTHQAHIFIHMVLEINMFSSGISEFISLLKPLLIPYFYFLVYSFCFPFPVRSSIGFYELLTWKSV